MSPTNLGNLNTLAKIPMIEVNRHSRVLAWGNNQAGWSAANSFTVPSEGGNMRCLCFQAAHGYFGATGFHAYECRNDGALYVYNRIFVNLTGHRIFQPMFWVVDLAPGSHSIGPPVVWGGTNNTGGANTNNKWSYFVLGTPAYGTPPTSQGGSSAVNLGAMSSQRHPHPMDTDWGRPQLHASTTWIRGDFHGVRQTGSPIVIPQPTKKRVLLVLSCTAYNSAANVIAQYDTYLDNGAGVQVYTGSAYDPCNDGPCHRVFCPVVWYGWLDPGTWCPYIVRSTSCLANSDDFGTMVAISGV